MSSRRPALRLRDILENAERIRAYTRDFDRDVLATDPMVYDATERCLTRISEAATKIGAWAEQHEPDYLWASLRSLGNVLRHEYDDVLKDRIADMVCADLPMLVATVRRMLDRISDD